MTNSSENTLVHMQRPVSIALIVLVAMLCLAAFYWGLFSSGWRTLSKLDVGPNEHIEISEKKIDGVDVTLVTWRVMKNGEIVDGAQIAARGLKDSKDPVSVRILSLGDGLYVFIDNTHKWVLGGISLSASGFSHFRMDAKADAAFETYAKKHALTGYEWAINLPPGSTLPWRW